MTELKVTTTTNGSNVTFDRTAPTVTISDDQTGIANDADPQFSILLNSTKMSKISLPKMLALMEEPKEHLLQLMLILIP